MPDAIRSGTGNGYLAGVNSDNNLQTACVSEELIAFHSKNHSDAFTITTPMLTLTTTGGRMIFIKNNESEDFRITEIAITYNGGSTNHNRCVEVQLGFKDTAPTTNTTTGALGILDKSSDNSANMDVLYWDEVGDGMTGGTTGALGSVGMISQGRTIFPLEGALILGVNNVMVIYLKAEEIGEANLNIRGFFQEVE